MKFYPEDCSIKFTASTGAADKQNVEALIFGVFEDEAVSVKTMPKAAALLVASLKRKNRFKGSWKQCCAVSNAKGFKCEWLVLAGLGKKKKFQIEGLRRALSAAVMQAAKLKVKAITIVLPQDKSLPLQECVEASVEAAALSLYTFDQFKSSKSKTKGAVKQVNILVNAKADLAPAKAAIKTASVTVNGAYLARDLGNSPANFHTPSAMAKIAKEISEKNGIAFKAFNESQIEKMGMGGLISVSRGSCEPPRFVVMEYNIKKGEKPLVLVGKGVTFDAGGISLKPSKNMHEMKFDMSGAAAVIGTLVTAARLKISKSVVGIVPLTENMPGGKATKPGDIIKTYSGKTVEVLNTDAEGRLILADALAYAKKNYKGSTVIDLATLTGACVVALGTYTSGIMGTDQELIDELKSIGESTGERVWQLPMWEEYVDAMKGDIADLKNISEQLGGGTSTAAGFLSYFIKGESWAHLDIAGTAWMTSNRDYMPKGGTGVGVRLLTQYLRNKK